MIIIPHPQLPTALPPWASGWWFERGPHANVLVAELRVGAVVIEFCWVPPGDFHMGSPTTENGRDPDETLHAVRLTRGYWLGRFPVTQEQYSAVTDRNPSHFKGSRHPVDSVTWDDAVKFGDHLRGLLTRRGVATGEWEFRLPTEAEWEHACRAGTTGAFNDDSPCTKPTGNDPALDPLGWFDKNSEGQTHRCGEKAANRWGLHDMHGNVWEWCLDAAEWSGKVITDTYQDGVVDPLCRVGARRVVRGGSCWNNAGGCRSAYRYAFVPGGRSGNRGFRLAAGQPVRGSGSSGSGSGSGAGGV